MIKVTFNFHSCFTVELDESILIFDYYKDTNEKQSDTCLKNINSKKKIFFFASHRHHDHFSRDIFLLKNDFNDITYIVSDDIWMKNSGEPIDFVSPNREYDINGIHIKTLKSTDEGVAFLVYCEGKVIYHAGDLHWWYWEEKGENYIKSWGEKYFKEIDKISNEHIDIAFVVLDPRMKNGEAKGLEAFLERVKDSPRVFPMHMWGDYHIVQRFLDSDKDKNFKSRIMKITKPGEVFNIDI